MSLSDVNDMSQAVKSNLFLYADDSCLLYQEREVEEIEKELKKYFESNCDWLVEIHSGEDKTKYL